MKILVLFAAALCLWCDVGQCADTAATESIVLSDATVFDSATGRMLPHRTIVISGELIRQIGTAEQPVEVPPGARTIDCRGRYVIPGLIDSHVHLVHLADRTHVTGDEFLPLFLAAGVTTVRSAGDAIVAESGVAHFAKAHPSSCPRVILASPLIDATPPFHRDVGWPIDEVEQVPKFVDDMAAWNVTTLKIYVGTRRPVGRAVIDAGHRRGMIVTAHLGAYSAQDAVEDGIDCLEHIWSVLDYSIPAETAGRPNSRDEVDLQNSKCQALVAELAKRQVAVDPTLVVFRNLILLNDRPEVREHPDLQLVPARMRTIWESGREKRSLPESTLAARQKEFAKYQELTGVLHRFGVPLLVGTDTPEPFVTPGFSMHQELELLVASGLSPAAALQAATFNGAKIVNQADKLGQIKPGMYADLVILSADPLEDIRHTRQIEAVVRGGRVVIPKDLLRLVPAE